MLEGVAENPEKAFEIATDIIGPSGDNVILAAATSLLSALIIYVDILSKQKHLTKSKMAALYALLGAYREGDLGYCMKSISSKECENAYMIFEESPSETQDTVYELLSKKLGALMKNSVCEIMNGQSIDLELPAKVPCAYFISFENFQSDMRFASSTFYHEAFRRLFKFAETQPDGKCRVPVNFLFDEFANIGSIQHLENLLEAGAEKAISVHMILNNIPQFSMLYPKSYLSILDHCAAVLFSPSAAANHLRDQAECPLLALKIVSKQGSVRRQHPYQRDLGEIQSFGHHLRSYHNIIRALGKRLEFFAVRVFIHGGIRIHPKHPRGWEQFAKFFLQFLGPNALIPKIPPAAYRAAGIRRTGVAAVVAHQPAIGRVIGHGNAAVRAGCRRIAAGADDPGMISTPVQKQNGLFVIAKIFFHFGQQRPAQLGIVPIAQLLPHIHNFHIRQQRAAEALL